MTTHDTLIGKILMGCLVLHQAFVVVLLLTRREDRKDHSIAMAVFFAANMMTAVPVVLSYFWAQLPFLAIGNISFPLVMLLGPALFFYARALVSPTEIRLSLRDAWHLVPFVISVPTVAALLILAQEAQTGDESLSQNSSRSIADALALSLLFLFIIATSGYLIRIIRILARYRRSKFDYFASLEGRSLTWFEWIIGALTAIWAVNVAIILDDNFMATLNISHDAKAAVEAAWVYAFSLMVLWQPVIFTRPRPGAIGDGSLPVAEDVPHRGSDTAEISVKDERYSRSALDDERIRRIITKIERAMVEDRLYRSQSITLRNLSDHTRVPENYLSQVLNVELNRNFYEFINHWRIKDACRLLAEGERPVVEIGEEVGFNSRSTFYAAFKREIGLTPSDFRSRSRTDESNTLRESEKPRT